MVMSTFGNGFFRKMVYMSTSGKGFIEKTFSVSTFIDKYRASNMDLEGILGNEGCNCSKMVFDNSFWHPQVTGGILREESLEILKNYFSAHEKG